MSNSPEQHSEGLITCSIYSENAKIKDHFGVISLWVRKEINRIGKAQLVLEAGNMPKQEILESEDETFAPGKHIRIEAGYKGSQNVIFEGIITSHGVEIAESEDLLIIECRDFAYPTTLSRKNRIFEKKKDSDAIKTILGEYSKLEPTVKDTNATYNELVQYYCSDWDFILSRADMNGLFVITEGKKISIDMPKYNASAVLTVTYGKDMLAFKGDLETEEQLIAAEAVAWDSTKQKLIKASGSSTALNKQGSQSPKELAGTVGKRKAVLQTTAISDETILKSWADAQMQKTGLARIRGEVKFQGNADIALGNVIELAGLSKRFNGNAYIGMVEHEIKEGSWVTTAGLGVSPSNITENTDVVAPLAAGLLPGIQGMHIGKVVAIEGDPDKENKIQIMLPILNGETNKVWARLATLWASNQYGGFFIPDVGDEVVVGFFNNDPCHAVILGSLYSSKQPPANKIEAKNNIRSIITRSKLKLEFEEEKKIITIQTPGKNTIEISDEGKSITISDQNKNKIEMSASGIKIESEGSLLLKAKTGIEINAGTSIEMKGKSAINMKSANIEAKADMAFTAKGGAQAELSAGGQAVIKGAMVMIN
ncbi:type VI secretion system tip protein VgrG [Pedobacter sp. ASV28]|uniref:type VI secretion system tip protein VgrG n=1 Tax=Pedobacter sp. ASV28 TaxID=2795123 RepID=UPI0018ED7910|nr:type VI secretion system tip protein VgrG [Pedobacter sp. ASV28]